MEIRKLTVDNYGSMLQLWSRAQLPFKPGGRDSERAFKEHISAYPDFFLGAFEGGRLVGTVILTSDLRKGWINRLAVDPRYTRRGIAKALIFESEKVFKKRGIRIFSALIEDSNAASKRLFKQCGYVEHRDIIYFSKRESIEV